MQSQEATLGGVLSIWTQPVDKCVAQSGDYSLGCRMLPAPSWTLGRTASTQPENAGLEQAQSLSSILFLNEKGCFQTAQCGYLNIPGMKRNCNWRLLVVLKKHIMPYFTKYLSFSFFIANFFPLGDVMTGMYRFHESVFFSFLFTWTSSLSCFFHQRTLQNKFLCMCLVFYLSKYIF